jgi:uncharacterized protein (DUF1501 family)
VYNANSTLHHRLRATAALIKADLGAEAIAIDLDGWDTHSAQGNSVGAMFNNMTVLATGLQAFYRDVIVQNRLNNLNLASVFPGFVPTFRGVTI